VSSKLCSRPEEFAAEVAYEDGEYDALLRSDRGNEALRFLYRIEIALIRVEVTAESLSLVHGRLALGVVGPWLLSRRKRL
jgi:hypothetical protein